MGAGSLLSLSSGSCCSQHFHGQPCFFLACLYLRTIKAQSYFFVSLKGYCQGMFVWFDFEGFLLNDFAPDFSRRVAEDTQDGKASCSSLLSVCTAAILVESF